MTNYERGLLIQNPYSSHFKHPVRRARVAYEMHQTGLRIDKVETTGPEQVREELVRLNAAEGGVVIFGAGGDGTAHHIVADALLSDEGIEYSLNRVPFVPLRAGNACDTAMMLNDKKSPEDILRDGREVDINPIEIRIDGERLAYALGYASLNSSALATMAIEDIKVHSKEWQRATGVQLLHEAYATWRALGNAEKIKLRHDGAEDWQEATEVAVVSGDRVAKLGRTCAELLNPEFHTTIVNRPGYFNALYTMWQLSQGRLPSRESSRESFEVASADGSMIAYQIDGEPGFLPSGAHVEAKTADVSFRTITTRRPATPEARR